ncbi:MAG: M1 family metallopeptidase [Calditrichia bacterium]
MNNGTFYYQNADTAFAQQHHYDVRSYELELAVYLDPSLRKGNLQGEMKIKYVILKDMSELTLNFSSNMQVDSIRGAEDFRHSRNLLKININPELTAGDTSAIIVYYHGWPQAYHAWIPGWTLETVGFNDKVYPWISTTNPPFGAQSWMPCKDDPSDKADSLRVRLNVPDSLVAVSNGILSDKKSSSNGRIIYEWSSSYPIATYLITVHIGPFLKYEQICRSGGEKPFPVQLYCFSRDLPQSSLVFTQLTGMFNYFNHVLGDYPFENEKYGMVKHAMRGGMENQTLTGVLDINPRRESLYAHELAHQWFGNMVTPSSFHDTWISEGLATYFTGLYLQHTRGGTTLKYYMKSRRYLKKGSVLVQDITDPEQVYHSGRIYYKAAWLFYMLHQKIGDEAFYQAIHNILEHHAYGNISKEQLFQEFEFVSNIELHRFFEQWVKEKVIPELVWEIRENKASQRFYSYNINVKQNQESRIPFEMPVELLFKGTEKDSLLRFELNQWKENFSVQLPYKVISVQVDPEMKMLLDYEIAQP